MTERISLRQAQLADIDDAYLSWYRNDDHLLDTFTGSRRTFTDEGILLDFKESLASQRSSYWLIIDNASGQKIGNVKIGPIDPVNKTSDLVCLIGERAFHGQGLAKQAVRQASQIAFERFDVRRLQSGMYVTNIASIKAYLGGGWQEEGLLKGFYWVDGKAVDRLLVCCLNPKYFPEVADNAGGK
jgi:RimJ/RimL family protein N-acetyltransferase